MQLFDVERDPVGEVAVRIDFGPAPLQHLDERDRLPIQRRVLGRCRRAQVRLQRDVAEIFQRHDAVRVGVSQQRGNRQRHLPEQLGDIGERQRGEVDRSDVQREHGRSARRDG